ncbi:MAG: hypothetical protein ACYTEU_06165 [Planctomycetota bacterium]
MTDIESIRNKNQVWKDLELEEMCNDMEELVARVDMYRDALAWYADRQNYVPSYAFHPTAEIELDRGQRARKVLNGEKWSDTA